MGRAARIAWILVGLLAVFGAIHAPLHADEAPCSPAALCSGGLVLIFAAVVVFATLLAEAQSLAGAPAVAARRRHPAFLVERGRAPPLV
jgi:hypothetical protein